MAKKDIDEAPGGWWLEERKLMALVRKKRKRKVADLKLSEKQYSKMRRRLSCGLLLYQYLMIRVDHSECC